MAATSSSTTLNDGVRAAFEAAVRERSARRHDNSYVIGYYISPRVLQVLAARVAAQRGSTPIKAVSLQRVVLVRRNARLFKQTSLALHAHVENVVLADSDTHRPQRLSASELKRLVLIAQRVHEPEFCKRLQRLQNGGDHLLADLQRLLASLIDRYTKPSIRSSATRYSDATPECIAERDGKRFLANVTFHSPQAASLPTSMPLPALSPSTLLSMSTAQRSVRAVHAQFPLRQMQNATISSLKSELSLQRAYAIYQRHPRRFTAYRIFFANDSTSLATEIARRCKDKNAEQAVREWIHTSIGPIPKIVYCGAITNSRSSTNSEKAPPAFDNCELRYLALVAAALTIYGEHVLSALYDVDSSMGGAKDIPLLSDEIRDARKQRRCLQRARWTGKQHTSAMHAAHYLPLDLAIQWNNSLSPALRLGAKELCWILNHPSNLRAVPHRVNLRDHRKVEHLISAFIRHDSSAQVPVRLKGMTWLAWRNTRDRLAHIAKRVQSLELRNALLRASGHALYAAIGETFQAIERALTARGSDFGAIWQQPDNSAA